MYRFAASSESNNASSKCQGARLSGYSNGEANKALSTSSLSAVFKRADQLAYIKDVFGLDGPSAVTKLAHSISSMNGFFLERKGNLYLPALTRRHIGAARTCETSPAAINKCAS